MVQLGVAMEQLHTPLTVSTGPLDYSSHWSHRKLPTRFLESPPASSYHWNHRTFPTMLLESLLDSNDLWSHHTHSP